MECPYQTVLENYFTREKKMKNHKKPKRQTYYMYVEQDIELQKQKASLITNIELLENQRKIGILEAEAGKPAIRSSYKSQPKQHLFC